MRAPEARCVALSGVFLAMILPQERKGAGEPSGSRPLCPWYLRDYGRVRRSPLRWVAGILRDARPPLSRVRAIARCRSVLLPESLRVLPLRRRRADALSRSAGAILGQLQDLVQRDGKLAHALPGRVVHGVREAGGHAGDADLADAPDAQR